MNLWENLSKYFMVTLVVLNLCILIGTSAVLGAFVRRGYGERKQSLSIDREYPEKLLYDDAVPLLSLPQVANLKPPSYRHKILQFSNEKMLNQPASSLGKLLLEYKTGCVALPQDYLVAGKLGNVYNSQLIASSITGNLGNAKDMRYNGIPARENQQNAPKYTPLLGTRSFTNLRELFQHITDNVKDVYYDELGSIKKQWKFH